MKKVLAVSYFLPPLLYPQSIQIGRLIRGLKRRFDLCVVTADQRGGPRDETLVADLFNGIGSVIRVPRHDSLYINYAMNSWLPVLFQRPDVYRPWMNRAFRAIDQAHHGGTFDAVVTFSFPASTNLLGARLKERFGARWISHNSDPWADNPLSRISRWTRELHRRLERETFTKADALLFPSDEMSTMYRERYPELATRIRTLNHSFDPEAYPSADIGGTGPASRPRILRYIGTFYGSRTPEPLYKALALLRADERAALKVEFVGGGRSPLALRERYGLTDTVAIRGNVPYRESLRLMVESDVLLVIDAPSADASVFFPSKLADYIGAGRPILGISPPGATRRILHNLGQSCHGLADTEAIAASLRDIVKTPPGRAPRYTRHDLEPYALDKNVQRLAETISP